MVYELRAQINQSAAISRLPAEMLCRVFHFARDACKVPLTSWERSEELNWIVVSQVFRHWRTVALNDPSLWAKVSLRFPGWTTELLQRSQKAGLSVTMLNVPIIKNGLSLASAVFAQAHRLVELTLRNSDWYPEMRRLLFDFGSLHLPNLKKLCLELGLRHMGPVLPAKLFQGTDQLRHLELWGVGINWDSHLFNGLTTLVLDNMVSEVPSWSQLRSMLFRMPELRSLTIRNILPSETPESRFIASPVHLPCLRKLCVDDDAVKCGSFYDVVSFSTCLGTNEGRFYFGDPNRQEDVGDICDLLSAADRIDLDNSLSASAQSLEIRGICYCPTLSFNMSLYATNSLIDSSIQKQERCLVKKDLPGIYVEFYGGGISQPVGDIANSIFTTVFHAFQFQALFELDLSHLRVPQPSRPDFSASLAATYGKLPLLHSVIVGREQASSLVKILHNPPHVQGSSKVAGDPNTAPSTSSNKTKDSHGGPGPTLTQPSSSIAFPALRNLRLHGITFGAGRDCDLSLGLLRQCLISRSGQDVGILTLSMENCKRISSKAVANLKDLVSHLECDGKDEF